MKQIKDVFKESLALLEEKKILCPKKSLERLLAHHLDCSPNDVYLFFDRKMDTSEFQVSLEKRLNSMPVEYILKKTFFYNSEFGVTPDVLIPRVETERLVDLIINKLASQDQKGKVLWDICTGSGCIGISLKKQFPDLTVILSDICPKALEIAEKNAQDNGVVVQTVLGDFLDPFKGMKADYIVSNPPYISKSVYQNLDKDVKDFEPQKALVAKESGLEFYRRFRDEYSYYLNPRGKIFFEIGYDQNKSLENLFSNGLNFDSKLKIEFKKDYNKKDRFFFLEIE